MASRGKMGDGDRRFAEMFKSAREARGLTQAQVMEAMNELGFDFVQQTVYKVENHLRRVTIGEAVALSSIVGVKLQDLVPPRSDLGGEIEISEIQAQLDLARTELEKLTAQTRAAETIRAEHEARAEALDNRRRELQVRVAVLTQTLEAAHLYALAPDLGHNQRHVYFTGEDPLHVPPGLIVGEWKLSGGEDGSEVR